MIDPLETIICHLKTDTKLRGLIGDRIAAKSLFGDKWTVGDSALVVQLYGGASQLEPYIHSGGIAVTAYGASVLTAMQVLYRVVEISQITERERVTTSQGDALLYYMNQSAAPTPLYDDTVSMDAALALFEIRVAQTALT